MSWIKEVDPSQVIGETRRVYDRSEAAFDGRAPDILRCVSLLPNTMEKLFDLTQTITFGGSRLTRVQEEAIATRVSALNKCQY